MPGKIDLMRILPLAMQTVAVVANADQNRDGKYATPEIIEACRQEVQAVCMSFPEISEKLKMNPEKMQRVVDRLVAFVQEVVS